MPTHQSRIALASQRKSLPVNSYSSPPAHSNPLDAGREQADTMPPSRTTSNGNIWNRDQVTSNTPRANASTGHYQRLARDNISASAHPLDDNSRSRYFGQSPLSLSTPRIGTR